MIRERTSQQPR
ncbi:Retrovirus-related Pol polyprotein from transposon 17.6, partial [Araneus ventricosus]